MEMDKQAEITKKKSSTMLTKPAIPPKYQMKPAPIIATTTRMQALVIGIRTSVGAAHWPQFKEKGARPWRER
uniref:Uncharacterized protein n=1 Tax=Romanomermis culicivorax TaxID=13658 RepID=A0A915HSJ3_ROMCU